jgi:hypothetical protein
MSVIERIVKQLNGKSVMLIHGKQSAAPTTTRSDDANAKPGVDE